MDPKERPRLHARDHLPGGADPIDFSFLQQHTGYQQHILDNMPDEGAYWPLDDTDTAFLADIGPNGKNGAYINDPTLQVGPLIGDGKAVAFHGGSATFGQILTGSDGLVGPDGSWTTGIWIQTTQSVGYAGADTADFAQLICCDDNARRYLRLQLDIAGGGVLEAICFDSGGAHSYSVVGATPVNDGDRHLAAARYDAGTDELSIWLDSVQDASGTGPITDGHTPSLLIPHVLIGARKPSAFFGSYYDGIADEAFLYGDAADDTFMSGLYTLGFDTSITGSKWYFGAGAPAASLGNNGDFYQDTTTGDIYQKVAGSWGSPIANSTVINPGDIGTTELADGSVTIAKLDSSGAADGKWLRDVSGAFVWEAITASEVSIVDAGGHYTSTDVEGALQEAATAGGGVPTSRVLTAGSGLAGGGDLSADRTFDVNVDGTTIEISSDTLRIKDVVTAGGPTGDSTHVAQITYNAKGQITAVSSVAISFPDSGEVAITAAPGSDDTASGVKVDLTAGETLAMGDPVYIKSDGKVWKGDADTAGTFPCMGLAITSAAANATVTVLVLGFARHDAWAWTVGGVVYLSTSSGLTQTQPSATDNAIQIIGIAPHADRLFVNPQLVWITHT